MSTKLRYDRYVKEWMHALPLGNGRVGAMIYGDPDCEVIEINEESLWSGRRIKEKNHATPEDLKRIRELVAENRLQEAAQVSRDTFLADPSRVRYYESFGEILIRFAEGGEYGDYLKELELADGIASVSWKRDGVKYKSECFVSAAYDALVYRVDGGGAPFCCSVTMRRKQDAYTAVLRSDTLIMNGRVTYSADRERGEGGEGMSFGARLRLVTDGSLAEEHELIRVTGATYLEIYGAFATNYDPVAFDIDEGQDYRARLLECMRRIEAASYGQIKTVHLQDHRRSFSRVRLELGGEDLCDMPTDKRLRRVRDGETADNGLYALYYNYGRYLLLASSGFNATLPANLQGVWCHDFRPPWGSDYHTNINLQMNYWPAEVAGLSHTVKPLLHFMEQLCRFGRQTASEQFGARGWCINHTTDIFGRTGVHDSVDCGFFPMAGPWMCLSLWEHYEYGGDIAVLERIYPVLKGACEFLLDYLCEDPATGYLVTSPSNSPENRFCYTEPTGEGCSSMLTRGATIDFEIVYALFTRVIHACRLLGVDGELAEELSAALDRLPPLRISDRYGTLCEWIEDYEETEPGHRHISHLFGLYPSDQINERDPAVYEAARRTIARRIAHGGEGKYSCNSVGWSQAWMISFYARLGDGEGALGRIDTLLKNCTADSLMDIHPPTIFQIDGNLGAVAGISEMLLQSHLGSPDERTVDILPALPAAWKCGELSGFKARGGLTVDVKWQGGRAVYCRIEGRADQRIKARINGEIFVGTGLLLYTDADQKN